MKAIALVTDRAEWGIEALVEIDEWFDQFEPVLPPQRGTGVEA